MGDFVTPETVRLPLSDGRTIDIVKRLTHGETEDMYARISPRVGEGVIRREVRTAKILAYLVGWSFMLNNKPVPYSPGMSEGERLNAIRMLDPDTAEEVHTAIEAHEDAEDKLRAERKKAQAGTPESAAISASPSAADGHSETSAP